MRAEEAKDLTAKAKEIQMNEFRKNTLASIKAAAEKGFDNLCLSNCLSENDQSFFNELGYRIELMAHPYSSAIRAGYHVIRW